MWLKPLSPTTSAAYGPSTCAKVVRCNTLLLQDKDGREFTGKQWPGIVVYPDFFKEDVTPQYWSDQVSLPAVRQHVMVTLTIKFALNKHKEIQILLL